MKKESKKFNEEGLFECHLRSYHMGVNITPEERTAYTRGYFYGLNGGDLKVKKTKSKKEVKK